MPPHGLIPPALPSLPPAGNRTQRAAFLRKERKCHKGEKVAELWLARAEKDKLTSRNGNDSLQEWGGGEGGGELKCREGEEKDTGPFVMATWLSQKFAHHPSHFLPCPRHRGRRCLCEHQHSRICVLGYGCLWGQPCQPLCTVTSPGPHVAPAAPPPGLPGFPTRQRGMLPFCKALARGSQAGHSLSQE